MPSSIHLSYPRAQAPQAFHYSPLEHRLESWSVQINGHAVGGYRSSGDSARAQICWLHGNGFNSLAYAPILQALEQADPGCQLYTTDLPGHGLSQPCGRGWPNWRSMAKTVEQAMRQQLIEPATNERIGIGHSLGGVVTLLQAHQYPQRFDRVLLLDPVLFPTGLQIAQQTAKSLGIWPLLPLPKASRRRRSQWESPQAMAQQLSTKRLYRDWHPQSLQGYVSAGHRTMDEGDGIELRCAPEWEAKIFASYPYRLNQAIREVQVPVHILCAHNSFPFVLKGAQRAAKVNPNISFERFGQGHCFPMEEAEQTAQFILDWIATTK